jgi:REP element-mobilizing transposase RayT
MPNHVHVVVRPFAGFPLSKILQSWKGFTGREANKLLGRSGDFWQHEPFDHLVRDADDLTHQIRYVIDNPRKAGLSDWPWVWARNPSPHLSDAPPR